MESSVSIPLSLHKNVQVMLVEQFITWEIIRGRKSLWNVGLTQSVLRFLKTSSQVQIVMTLNVIISKLEHVTRRRITRLSHVTPPQMSYWQLLALRCIYRLNVAYGVEWKTTSGGLILGKLWKRNCSITLQGIFPIYSSIGRGQQRKYQAWWPASGSAVEAVSLLIRSSRANH